MIMIIQLITIINTSFKIHVKIAYDQYISIEIANNDSFYIKYILTKITFTYKYLSET